MPYRNNGGKSMLGGTGLTNVIISNYLNDININTISKADVKNVEDIQQIIGYYNHVIADIQAKKKKM